MTIAQVKRKRRQMKVDPRYKTVMIKAKDREAFKAKRK